MYNDMYSDDDDSLSILSIDSGFYHHKIQIFVFLISKIFLGNFLSNDKFF